MTRHPAAKIGALAAAAALLTVLALSRDDSEAQSGGGDDCPDRAPSITHAGGDLQSFAEAHGEGVIFDEGGGHLALGRAAAEFRGVDVELGDEFSAAAAADFDGDGWDDLVVGSSSSRAIRLYQNRTFESPEPDWSDPSAIREPRFEHVSDIEPADLAEGHVHIVAGDFNQNGNADFFYYRNEGVDHSPLVMQRIYLGNGDGTFEEPYDATGDIEDFGYLTFTSTNAVVTDYNDNGWPDILFGTKLGTSDDSGAVIVFLNDCPDLATTPPTPCSRDPRFQPRVVMTGLDLGDRGASALTFGDFTNNGVEDLMVGSPSYDGLRLYPGLPGGGFDADFQSLEAHGPATVTLAADLTGDGRLDFVYGGQQLAGDRAHVYLNDGTSTPFSGGVSEELAVSLPTSDVHTGAAFDYDNDPAGTTDLLIADDDALGTLTVFANRVTDPHVTCGEVASGPLDLGSIADEEMVISSARISPELALTEGTSVDFYAANQDPPNWTKASPCSGSSGDYCVSFDEPTGNELQWRAVMCSDASGARTPTLSGLEIDYDRTVAGVHYRAGIVVDRGVAYAAGLSHPGARGRLFAVDAELTTTYWDAGEVLDSMSDSERRLYTASADGATRIGFGEAYADDEQLLETLGVADADRARDVIAWARSPRFGPDAQHRLGAVGTSTPAVLAPPSRPVWYLSLSEEEREDVDDFIRAHSSRPTLVLFGSQSGMIHAVRSNPAAIASPESGEEAWGFLPPRAASRLESDMTRERVSAYPDGAPTLADIRGPDGEMMTVAVMGGGYGLESAFALDVTDTVDADTGEVTGPEPLWHAVPGDGEFGKARTTPVVIRSEVDDQERFIAVLGSGPAYTDPDPPYTKGRDVLAVDAATGEELWRFRAACTLTADISAFARPEPDPDPEDDPPEAFIDRVVVADACGNVYKLDPGVDRDGGFVDSSEFGTIDTGAEDPDGRPVFSLFSTTETPGALGGERPIAGNIGARPDASGRTVLFFGTGGLASADPSLQNAFYAVYADTGEIRDELAGECFPEGCEKFYGGVVLSGSQVFLTRAVDPPAGSGLCNAGQSTFQALDINTLTLGFEVVLDGRATGPLFGREGAVYVGTESGAITRVGQPGTPSPGEGDGEGGDGEGDGDQMAGQMIPTEVMAWRRLF